MSWRVIGGDLITSPAYVVVEAADSFGKTTAPNQVWDRLHLPESHRLGLFYLSTILDDYSRYVVAWKLRTTMKAEITDTLTLALPTGLNTAGWSSPTSAQR